MSQQAHDSTAQSGAVTTDLQKTKMWRSLAEYHGQAGFQESCCASTRSRRRRSSIRRSGATS